MQICLARLPRCRPSSSTASPMISPSPCTTPEHGSAASNAIRPTSRPARVNTSVCASSVFAIHSCACNPPAIVALRSTHATSRRSGGS